MKFRILLMLAMAVLADPSGGQGVPRYILDDVRSLYLSEANTAFRYSQYAAKALEEQLQAEARLFAAVSKGEAIHSRNYRETLLSLGEDPGEFIPDAVQVGTTSENLEAAIQREQFEMHAGRNTPPAGTPLPPEYTDRQAAEAGHAKLFREALDGLGQNVERDYFVCDKCGYVDVAAGNCAGCHDPAVDAAETDRN